MAISFDDAYLILQRIGPEIGQLMLRGDKLAKDVFDRYKEWHNAEHRRWKMAKASGQYLPDTRLRRSVVSALEQYLQRDLLVSEREQLAGAKGHIVEKPTTNLIDLSVSRALRARR